MNSQPHQGGLTLIELMTTLAVAVLVLAVAVPSYQDLVRKNQMTTAANKLVADISFARSEAVKRNVEVSICPSDDGAGCVDNDDYSDPWSSSISADAERVIFLDTNDDDDFAGDQVIRRSPVAGYPTVSAGVSILTFQANGLVAGAPYVFAYSDPQDKVEGRCVVLAVTGRAEVRKVGDEQCPD